MKALAKLAQFLGQYDDYKQLLRTYDLKWTCNTDDVILARLAKNANSDDLTEWIRTVKKTCPEFVAFVDFTVATGLRFDEALSSYNLIIELARANRLGEYYKAETGSVKSSVDRGSCEKSVDRLGMRALNHRSSSTICCPIPKLFVTLLVTKYAMETSLKMAISRNSSTLR
jgi:hypothetical protein